MYRGGEGGETIYKDRGASEPEHPRNSGGMFVIVGEVK